MHVEAEGGEAVGSSVDRGGYVVRMTMMLEVMEEMNRRYREGGETTNSDLELSQKPIAEDIVFFDNSKSLLVGMHILKG